MRGHQQHVCARTISTAVAEWIWPFYTFHCAFRATVTANGVHLQLLRSVNLAFTSCSERHVGLLTTQTAVLNREVQACLQLQAYPRGLAKPGGSPQTERPHLCLLLRLRPNIWTQLESISVQTLVKIPWEDLPVWHAAEC